MSVKSIAKNSVIYIFFEALNKVLPFILLPILTYYLAPADLGLVAEFVSLIGILAVFTGLTVHGAVNVAYFKLDRQAISSYIFNAIVILVGSTCIVLMVSVFGASIFQQYFHLPVNWLYVAVVVAALKFVTTINLVLWQAEKKPLQYGAYQSLQITLNFLLTILFVVIMGLGWEGRVTGHVMAVGFFAIISIVVLARRGFLNVSFNVEQIKDALKFGVPLIPHQLSAWVFFGFNILLISTMLGKESAGIFNISMQLAMVMYLITESANRSLQPYLYEKLGNIDESGKKRIVKYTYLGFLLAAIVGVFVWMGSVIIIEYVIDDRYHEAAQYIFLLVISHVVNGFYFFVSNYIFYEKKTHYLSLLTFLAAIVHLIAAYSLIKPLGLKGVALASVISSTFYFISVWWLSVKVFPLPWFRWHK
jgi:O-antigen/teichoic acid export membrane protein